MDHEHDEALDFFDYCGHQHGEGGEREHDHESDEFKEESQDAKYEVKGEEAANSQRSQDSSGGYAVVDTGNYDEPPQSVQSYTQNQQQPQNWQNIGQQQSQQQSTPRTLPVEKTLWMGDMNPVL